MFKPLLRPHLDDMERKVAPGVFILSWTSMNIDGYLHRFKQARDPASCHPARSPPACSTHARDSCPLPCSHKRRPERN